MSSQPNESRTNQEYETYTLSNNAKIPKIGLGVYLVPPQHTASLVYEALNIGYRLIDTAQIYRNETEVSEGVLRWLNEDPDNRKRQDIFIVTKIWDSFHGYESAKTSIRASIRKICIKGIDYIDLFLIHSPNSDRVRRIETYRALQEAQESSFVKSIGVSNYGEHHLQELFSWSGLLYPPTVNQLEIHPWLTRHKLVEYCKQKHILIQAYSPLAKGRKFNDPDLNKISGSHNKTNAQILVRWSIQMGFVVLPKTFQKDRLVSNFQVWDFQLSDKEMSLLTHPTDYFITGWDPTLFKG